MLLWFSVALIASISRCSGLMDTIICSTNSPCVNITCNTSEIYDQGCQIDCNNAQSCVNTTIDCGDTSVCNINCLTSNSCTNTIIYAINSNYLNVTLTSF